jgi:hypothetical protein
MAARMSCGQLAVDNPSSAKRRSSCLVSMLLARWMRTQEAAQLPPAGHESSHSELRASPDRKSLFKYEFDDIRVVSDPYKAVPLMLFAHAHAHSRRLERMEHAELASEKGHESRPSRGEQDQMDWARAAGMKAARKAVPKKARLRRPLPKQIRSKSKSVKLVCRYCWSDDLAPSFIKRRDRRCRNCFRKRYGSAARA